jgi:putative pyruvate formate lyase activating enzyme
MCHEYAACRLCPRDCGVDRLAGRVGWCGEGAELRLAAASIHRGEEPPVTGAGGSGAIFLTGCALRCSFCQNGQISHHGLGRAVGAAAFADICLALENAGAENINLVTPGHAAPALKRGLDAAEARGLSIPALWNSSAYETPETIDLMADTIAVYLPDLKTLDPDLAGRYFQAPDYPRWAAASIERMVMLRPLVFGPGRDGKTETIRSGTVVRHLVLPGQLESTRAVLRFFADKLAGRALLSLMTQYTPVAAADRPPPSDRYVDRTEFDAVQAMLEEFGIEDGFYQELVVSSDWLPDFCRTNPFGSELSRPIWHWRDGFVLC